ncbi:MAG: hypothetical protein IT385_15160 [Deltaproteobacteria bacterium]|nr:hypothetical protein [Deltaproteobacteria bacterium]
MTGPPPSDFERAHGDDLEALVGHLDDRERVLALLEGHHLPVIEAAWEAVRRRVGEGRPDPAAELTYGLTREHLARWPRACLGTMRAIPAVDRVVRVIELTTTGYVCAVTPEAAWHAYLMADGLPADALAYLREHAGGRHFQELVQRTPPEAIASKRAALGRASAGVRRDAPRPSWPEGSAEGLTVEIDRGRGLVVASADRIELADVAWSFGGVAVEARRVEARGVLVDARVATELEPTADNAMLVRVGTLALHEVRLVTPDGAARTCERIDARGIVIALQELARGALAPSDPVTRKLLADIPGEVVPTDTLAAALDALADVLARPLAGPILGGVGGGTMTIGGVSLRALDLGRGVGRVRGVELGAVQLRLDKAVAGGKEAPATEVASFVDAYARWRVAPPEAHVRDRLFALRRVLEGTLVAEVASARLVAADLTWRGVALMRGRVEVTRAALTLRSRRLACHHVPAAMLVADGLEGVERDLALPPAPPAEVEATLGELALTEGEVARVDLFGASIGHAGLRLSEVRATRTRIVTGAGKIEVGLAVPSRFEGRVALACGGLRIERGERDTRVNASDVSSIGVTLRGLDDGVAASWRGVWPDLEVARFAGLGLDATWLSASRTLTFSATLGQAQVASCGWPRFEGAPAIVADAGGLVIGATSVRGAAFGAPPHVVVEEARVARLEARGVERVAPGAPFAVTIGRGALEEVRVRGLELPAPRTARAATMHVGRVSLPEVVVGALSGSVTASAIEVSRGADGRLAWSSGPISMEGALTGALDAPWRGLVGRGSATLEAFKGGRARDGQLSLESASATCELRLERVADGGRGELDARVQLRAPAIVGHPRATLGLRVDGGDVALSGRDDAGDRAIAGKLDARGLTARADLTLGPAPRLVVRTATLARAQLDDVRWRWRGGEVASPQARLERVEARDVTLAHVDAGGARRVAVVDGTIKGEGLAFDRARVTLGGLVEASVGAWRSSGLDVRLAPPTRVATLGDVQVSGLALGSGAGRLDLATLRVTELALDERAGAVAARARSAVFRVGGAAPERSSDPRGGRATLAFLDNMRGEIGITVPIGNERITGQLVVAPDGVEIAPTLVASHALQEQYWGWAPRWLVSHLVVAATRYVADFFERELVALRSRLAARVEGGAAPAPTRIASEVVAQSLVDAMVRWSAAVDVLTPRGRGRLAVIGDASELWIAPAAEPTDAGRERRMQDIAAWARAIGVAVGIQATGEAQVDLDRSGAGPRVAARVGARLAGAGTLGAGLDLSFDANLSHVEARVGDLVLGAATATIDEGGRRGGEGGGLSCTAVDLTLRREPRP